uniref:asparagine synthase (glutamine-hydrolyzing) n=1 Tax=viral metagenome TaxID=1070528 RepID=A0A6C0IST8_9ZZZZ
MCGIFSIINYITTQNNSKNDSEKYEIIEKSFHRGKGRGPEYSTLEHHEKYNALIGFHRLAINGLNMESNQPIIIDDIALICNGEIYNFKQLYDMMPFVNKKTDSDCEVIIHLYKHFGMEQTLRMLDGVFSFILYTSENIYVARDPYGVRPLYCCLHPGIGQSYFASELKSLTDIQDANFVEQFKPGHYIQFDRYTNVYNNNVYYKPTTMSSVSYYKQYHIPSFPTYNDQTIFTEEYYLDTIYRFLKTAVYKRCCTTERPIACLLSGGLDSSLIASLVCQYAKEYGLPQVETYSIGLPDSEDIKYAKKVAEHIGSKHTEIIVSEMDMVASIPKVIEDIESYDTTTVRASIGNWLIGKYISEHSEAKVIFNGDGSDELCGGYLYMSLCPSSIEFDKETIRLLNDIYLFDVLRSDKSISSHGLEPRTPFLDKNFVNIYLSIPLAFRHRTDQIEKYLLRKAFDNKDLLPSEILWRKKEAFSDGVSNKGRSLYQIIQDFIKETHTPKNNMIILSPIELEKDYYKKIFFDLYPRAGHIVPYYWMPKYTSNTNDPSARTLSNYS